MWEKNKRTTKYDKNIIICNIGTIQCEDRTIKCRKKKKKKKGTIKCDESTIRCNTDTASYNNRNITCVKKKNWNHKIWQKYCNM